MGWQAKVIKGVIVGGAMMYVLVEVSPPLNEHKYIVEPPHQELHHYEEATHRAPIRMPIVANSSGSFSTTIANFNYRLPNDSTKDTNYWT